MGDFLGVRIENVGPGTCNLTKSGLTNKVLTTTYMTYCKPVHKTRSTVPLSMNTDVVRLSEDWGYKTIVRMLIYIAQNARATIAYDVHQYARFTHASRKSNITIINTWKVLKIRDSCLFYLANSKLIATLM